jgi:DNA-binding LacI/PurR family transcriptional regulator
LKKKKAWVVVLPFYSAQYEELLQRLSIEAKKTGRELHHLLDHNLWEEEIRMVGSSIHEGYEAVIVIPTLDEARTAPFYARLSPGETFVALIDHTLTGSYFPYVIQSYDLGIQRGMQYLIQAGCQKIALVKNGIWSRNNRLQALMEETFRQASGDNGAECLVLESSSDVTREQIDSSGIDGVFCLDDVDAVRVIGRVREQGIKFPGRLRLVSYGNTELARYFTPAITSIDPHNAQMAAKAGEIISMHLKGKSTKMLQFMVQPELVIRKT